MSNAAIKVPILLLVYNRADLTRKIFNVIKKIQPLTLYIHADGPKDMHDNFKCEEVRKIFEDINWKCNVNFFSPEKNMGCTKSTVSSIDRVFEKHDKVILLEDDTVPSESFFSFCQTMLYLYENDNRVMGVCGSTLFSPKNSIQSYYFSRIAGTWGFATWKRAWNLYDRNLSSLPIFRKSGAIKTYFSDEKSQKYWLSNFDRIKALNCVNGWDYIWAYSIMSNYGLCIYPSRNLITNIGFNGVHASNLSSLFIGVKKFEILELRHPQLLLPNKEAEIYENSLHIQEFFSISVRIKHFIRRYFLKKPLC